MFTHQLCSLSHFFLALLMHFNVKQVLGLWFYSVGCYRIYLIKIYLINGSWIYLRLFYVIFYIIKIFDDEEAEIFNLNAWLLSWLRLRDRTQNF